jgi:uncharacterized RDD family membrane protein YckC
MASSGESKPKYVWDRDKLAWVEAAPGPTQEEVQQSTRADEAQPGSPELPLEDSSQWESTEVSEESIGLEYRGAWVRVAAVVLDFVVLAIVNLIIGQVFGLDNEIIANYVVPAIGIVYFIALWGWRGQSLGKIAVGAKIVKLDGSDIGFVRAALRYLVGYFIYIQASTFLVRYVGWYMAVIIFLVVFLSIALSRDKRAFHDRIAGTIVINTRPKTLEEYADEEYEEEELSYSEAEQEPLVSEKA